MTNDQTPSRILVTGGAGFIGSAVVRRLVSAGYHVANVDKLTYAGTLTSLKAVETAPNYRFYQADIADQRAILVLHHYLGLDSNEIGEVLDIPAGTARSRLHYAHRAMRALLEADARPTALAGGRSS